MSVKSDVERINEQLEKLAQESRNLDRLIAETESSLQAAQASVAEETARAIADWDKNAEQVKMFYRIACENTQCRLDKHASPSHADLHRLNSLIGLINQANKNDASAARVVALSSQYLAWIDIEKDKALRSAKSQANASVLQQKQQLMALKKRKSDVFARVSALLHGQDAVKIRKTLDVVAKIGLPTTAQLNAWKSPIPNRTLLAGQERIRVRIPRQAADDFIQAFGHHADGNSLLVPVPLKVEQGWHIRGSMKRGYESPHYEALQTVTTNLLMRFGTGELTITVVDLVHFNLSCLGEYARLADSNSIGGGIPLIQYATDRDELDKLSRRLIMQYKAVRRQTGPKTVAEYNSSHDDKLPYNLLIIVRDDSHGYTVSYPPGVSNLVNNSRAYGVTVLELVYSEAVSTKTSWSINTGRQALEVVCLPETVIPGSFVSAVSTAMQPRLLGTKYSARHKPHAPKRSKGKRRPIEVPFAIDSRDREITCKFEDDDFAAYIMGAAGSGKSTLLHALIAGLISNYHPDEVELWLVDFKRTEFVRYSNMCPPHVRYLLLEESEELLFDLIDELTRQLDLRLKTFASNGWSKLSEVPPEKCMPALFVIIDEFAQVSQHLQETRGDGVGFDYTLKLENLLAKGRAAGLKFIFASQSYTTGVVGLTETARKQIKMRLALRNTSEEIRDTLGLMHNQMTDDLLDKIASIERYQTIYVRSNPSGGLPIVDLYRNEYLTYNELEQFVSQTQGIRPRGHLGVQPPDNEYLDKHRVLLVDNRPHTFKEMIPLYSKFESDTREHADLFDVDDEDLLLYPGVPCSFNQAKPLVLRYADGQNMLLVNRSRDDQASIVLSILRSWSKHDHKLTHVEIWASGRNPVIRRYRRMLERVACQLTPQAICQSVGDLQSALNSFDTNDRLIVIIGMPDVLGDCRDFATMSMPEPEPEEEGAAINQDDWDGMDLLQLVEARLSGRIDSDAIDEYNRHCDEPVDQNDVKGKTNNVDERQLQSVAGDIDSRMVELLQRGPRRGVHVLATFNRVSDFEATRINVDYFQHRMASSLSRIDSHTIFNSPIASGLETGTFIYTDGEHKSVMRPHIHPSVPNNGWILSNGTVKHANG